MARQARKVDLENPQRPIVCVDLNGVLDAYTGWKHADHWDAPRAGAHEFLRALTERGFDVVVFTTPCRHAPPEMLTAFGWPVASSIAHRASSALTQ
jgi:hypothetical protein